MNAALFLAYYLPTAVPYAAGFGVHLAIAEADRMWPTSGRLHTLAFVILWPRHGKERRRRRERWQRYGAFEKSALPRHEQKSWEDLVRQLGGDDHAEPR